MYGIVKQHEGHIAIDSPPGGGTTFTVYLRRVEDLRAPVAVEAGPPPRGRRTETILLVEDEEAVRNLARQVLGEAGYTVLAAANGAVALQIAEQWRDPIHLVLTDVVMPRMNGRLLAERVRALRPDVKVLYISGYTDDVIRRYGTRRPGTYLLDKPFPPAVLLGKVREILDSPPTGSLENSSQPTPARDDR